MLIKYELWGFLSPPGSLCYLGTSQILLFHIFKEKVQQLINLIDGYKKPHPQIWKDQTQ